MWLIGNSVTPTAHAVFTFLDSFNLRAQLPQRGHGKQGRDNLRLLGLAVLATADGDVPLLHHTYAGNHHDSVMFHSVAEQLLARCRAFSREVDQITLVFDKGNNSEENLRLVDHSSLHFVGSLVPTHHPDLLAIPRQDMRRLDRSQLPAVWAYRRQKPVFGVSRTVVVTFNQKLFCAQRKTLTREINQRLRKLERLQATWSAVQPEIFYWRTASGQEVDVVLEDRAGKVTGVEIKAAATLSANDVRSLQALADMVGKNWLRGVVLYTGTEVVPFSSNIHGIPISRLWLVGRG